MNVRLLRWVLGKAEPMRFLAITLILGLSASGPANATLIDRGGGLIYDDVLDITWTQDANLCVALGNCPGGLFVMQWDTAVDWADKLVFGGFEDWRLASVSRAGGLPTGGADAVVVCLTATELVCRDNELGYMYYHNLGGTFPDNLTGDQGLIQNIQALGYWSGTENPSATFPRAWGYSFFSGVEFNEGKGVNRAAWAVRPGDVLVRVPEPSTLLLLAAGLASLGFGRRRSQARAQRS